MDDTSLDRAIDDVAHDMTAADVPSDFRAAVMARVSTTPRRGFPFSGLAPAAVAAAVLVVAVVLWQSWPLRGPSEPPPSVEMAAAHLAPTEVPQPQSTAEPVVHRGGASPDATLRRPLRPRTAIGHSGLAWEAGPGPLPGIDPLAIAAAGPAPLDTPALDIAPMHDLEPITVPVAGSGLPDPKRRDR